MFSVLSTGNHHLSKTIELSRIHLFNIVTQYRAIFSDDDPILPLAKDQNINESAIFYSWITEKVKCSCKYSRLNLLLILNEKWATA